MAREHEGSVGAIGIFHEQIQKQPRFSNVERTEVTDSPKHASSGRWGRALEAGHKTKTQVSEGGCICRSNADSAQAWAQVYWPDLRSRRSRFLTNLKTQSVARAKGNHLEQAQQG
jgi:hypothetical protein